MLLARKLPNNTLIFILLFIIIVELVYFNIVYDVFCIALLFLAALSMGSYFPVKLKVVDRLFVQLSLGLGVLGFVVWISTFSNYNYKSIYLLVSIIIITIRQKQLKRYLTKAIKVINLIIKQDRFYASIIIVLMMALIIPASYPIWQFDSLSKHIAIPNIIMNRSNWDYNVIEFIGYGDYALLPHMYYLYLMVLGGTKAIVLFNTLISFVCMFIITRISVYICKAKFTKYYIALLYCTTPIIYILSTVLYVDIIPLLFIFSSTLILFNMNVKIIEQNVYYIALLLGFAFFAKQMAIYFIIPIGMTVIYYLLVKPLYLRKALSQSLFKKFMGCIILFLAPFLPAISIIYYKTGNPFFPFMNGVFKSIYFSQSSFKDPFTNLLGLNLNSLYSIVFHTSRNIELADGGIGYFLLFIPFTLIMIFFIKNKFYKMTFFITFASYIIAIQFNSNIRYMIGSTVFALILCVVFILHLVGKIKKEKYNLIMNAIFLLILLIPNLIFIISPNNYWGFKLSMLKPNSDFTINDNEEALNSINYPNVRVLSDNDVFRGTFKGEYYTLSWYNTFLLEKIIINEISMSDLISSFDYYLVDKRKPTTGYVKESEMGDKLELLSETDTHKLFKIMSREELILHESFDSPIYVTVSKPEIRAIENKFEKYRIVIRAKKVSDGEYFGRWQINWHDAQGKFITTSLIPFKLEDDKVEYNSPIIGAVPKNAVTGIFYLVSNDESEIMIYDCSLYGIQEKSVVDRELEKYNLRCPHLSNRKYVR